MNPYAILAALVLLAGAAGSGAYAEKRYRDGLDAEAALAQSEANRETERTAARDRASKLDHFAQVREADRASSVAAVRSADGVRREADRLASRARAAGASADSAAVAVLAGLLAEGADLAREGREDLEQCWGRLDAIKGTP